MDDYSSLDDDELNDYDIYGKTPPRTKILRKNRERRQKERETSGVNIKPKILDRRRTLPNVHKMSKSEEEDTEVNNEQGEEGPKRTSKRQLKLLRGSERDLKLDIASAQAVTEKMTTNGEKQEYVKTPSFQVEHSKCFMSLMSRTVQCAKSFKQKKLDYKAKEANKEDLKTETDECPQSRVEFYDMLKTLIRMGSGEKNVSDRNPRRALSREETLWQTELKDVIWLELQAFHAERSPMEEDSYLCSAREMVEPLLNDIKNYRFQRHKRHCTQNSDNGVGDDCSGCLSIYCINCLEAQTEALKEVEQLLKRLEEAESLFPSSKAFAELYPLYSSPEIVGKVKSMCLWYNMTRHQKLKLSILGRLMMLLEDRRGLWLVPGEETGSTSPSDSNNSSNSSTGDLYSDQKNSDIVNMAPIIALLTKKDGSKVSPYRRYIENVLKTRTLDKSLNFLRKLHTNVLKKTQLTLEKPKDDSIFSEISPGTEEEELRRYGSWSPEARSAGLPSYRAMFVCLSIVPMTMLHEYLLMRLEQKPENPSPLSVRQLMRELKEGLKLAVAERKRTCGYIESAISGTKEKVDSFNVQLASFDDCVSRIFNDYLDYLEQWILLYNHTFQKNLLEDEYDFCLEMCEIIPNGKELIGRKFSFILGTILQRIGDRLLKRIDEVLEEEVNNCDDGMVKQRLLSVCRHLQSLFSEERELCLKSISFFKTHLKKEGIPSQCMLFLKESIIAFKCIIPDAIAKVQGLFEHTSLNSLDEADKLALNARIREILMQVYRFGFDFYKEMSDTTPSAFRGRLVHSMVDFATLWMKFVTERCERGRGMRPRWAYQGMEFLLTVCEPTNTKHLTEEKFEQLKKDMDVCISHVIGTTAPSTPDSGFYSASPRSSIEQIRSRSRGSSPSPRPTYKSQRSGANRKISIEQHSPGADSLDSTCLSFRRAESPNVSTVRIKFPPQTRSEHWVEAVEMLDQELDNKLRNQDLIGKVLQDRTLNRNVLCKRTVTFSWQRGIKIGQGRFGKVYTAVNNNTGEMMAVKEIPLALNDSTTVKRIAEEMKILEGIVHKNLVRYYGVEVHKDEMLLFMEYCSEGTLENLIASTEKGLPELLVRRYTFQLLCGVVCLHDHGIVHRDIKTANIFLTNEGNCLKIGDFGCAAKIKSSTTMPGELQGFVGTQAYMAPEVFTKNMSEGHGRAADVWSIGCVVVEMASGKVIFTYLFIYLSSYKHI
ncbi:unnamed protein product [Acanthoscelides obtectus]|uniref:Protein kinase domain-containing protein n=1 Tax=Acanthoscelides obtectus TaxID=200917 RepID=A0A9P0JXS3_ACAOB|nr:unnamed protein product [Acanthoscelides obtectus]CAK1631483.1 Mitogen-activated protein kinase kinase kinase 4 [Acanthoscelides obtectus]